MGKANGQPCTLCDQLDGAVIQCTDCDVYFHASCAWLLGYKFGFEFTLVRTNTLSNQVGRQAEEAEEIER
jgi:hypothetical protein